MSSLYAQYIKEREGKHIFEQEFGYATYSFHDEICYIEDIYVAPEKRKSTYASKLADGITIAAKEKGCTVLMGSVCVGTEGDDTSIKVLHGYGMKLSHIDGNDNMIYFKKEI